MKKVQKCVVENCIPTPSSCVEWNGGDIESLGICNGQFLNDVIIEIVTKLKEIAGTDLSSYDLDALLELCNKKAPLEVNLISILNVLKENQLCLKDYIDTLNEKISDLSSENNVSVNLKCYDQIDSIGNSLSITRDQLDQLVIDQLCANKNALTDLQGKYTTLKNTVDSIDPHATVDEPNFATCNNATIQSTSSHVKGLAKDFCALRGATGDDAKIAQALSKTPAGWNTKYQSIVGWNMTPAQLAESYGNLLLVVANLEARVAYMEQNCCAVTCEDIKVGFVATLNDQGDGIIISFTSGAGTNLPAGFLDKGTTGTATDADGNIEEFVIPIYNGAEQEIVLSSLDLSREITININSKVGNDSLTCEKCLNKTMKVSSNCCVFSNPTNSDVTLFYETSINA